MGSALSEERNRRQREDEWGRRLGRVEKKVKASSVYDNVVYSVGSWTEFPAAGNERFRLRPCDFHVPEEVWGSMFYDVTAH